MDAVHRDGYSAKVDIRLEINNRVLSVAQVGRDSLVLSEPAYEVLQSSEALVVITVDGREHNHEIVLHRGISQNSTQVEFL